MLALFVFFLFSSAANATTIDFDIYTNIEKVEDDYNLDFSALWDIKTDGTVNQVGYYIDFADSAEYIDFKSKSVQMQSVYVLSAGGMLLGYKEGLQTESMTLPIFTPETLDLSIWEEVDKLVFSSGMVTIDDLSYEVIYTPIPSAVWLFSGGLLVFAGIKRRFQS
ncbi:MAG: hypothetical protein JRJ73_07535 [Deltaproteobacteria bacterium]|nr:hypothetical protein [Deltaproteobacteria bacterium]MBW2051501.1 hypothetical protein [Deltaproteobacteria bacterium]